MHISYMLITLIYLILSFLLQISRKVLNIDWNVEDSNYSPIEYTAPIILRQPAFADKPTGSDLSAKWNTVDGNINRCSHEGSYNIVNGIPRLV